MVEQAVGWRKGATGQAVVGVIGKVLHACLEDPYTLWLTGTVEDFLEKGAPLEAAIHQVDTQPREEGCPYHPGEPCTRAKISPLPFWI